MIKLKLISHARVRIRLQYRALQSKDSKRPVYSAQSSEAHCCPHTRNPWFRTAVPKRQRQKTLGQRHRSQRCRARSGQAHGKQEEVRVGQALQERTRQHCRPISTGRRLQEQRKIQIGEVLAKHNMDLSCLSSSGTSSWLCSFSPSSTESCSRRPIPGTATAEPGPWATAAGHRIFGGPDAKLLN